MCIGLVCLIAGGVGEVHGALDDVDLPESALPQRVLAAVGATISTAVAAPAQPQQAQVVSGPGMAQVHKAWTPSDFSFLDDVNGNLQGEENGPKFGEEPFALTLPGMGDEEPLPSTLLLDLSGFHNARCNGVYRRMEGSNFYASETTLLYPDNPYWRLTDRSQLPLVQKPARRHLAIRFAFVKCNVLSRACSGWLEYKRGTRKFEQHRSSSSHPSFVDLSINASGTTNTGINHTFTPVPGYSAFASRTKLIYNAGDAWNMVNINKLGQVLGNGPHAKMLAHTTCNVLGKVACKWTISPSERGNFISEGLEDLVTQVRFDVLISAAGFIATDIVDGLYRPIHGTNAFRSKNAVLYMHKLQWRIVEANKEKQVLAKGPYDAIAYTSCNIVLERCDSKKWFEWYPQGYKNAAASTVRLTPNSLQNAFDGVARGQPTTPGSGAWADCGPRAWFAR